MSEKADIEKLIHSLEKQVKYAPLCGGSVSSSELRDALKVLSLCSTNDEIERVNKVVEVWRAALRRHNAQEEKFFTYDIETGEVKR